MKNKLHFGVGTLDADYPVRPRKGNKCPYYARWLNMLARCYSTPYLKTHPSYDHCEVCDEWLTFSNFKTWMKKQEWKENALDKDLLGDGKMYSPTGCAFIPKYLNNFLLDRAKARGERLLGVSKKKNRFCAWIRDNGVSRSLGSFDDELSAHRAWQRAKINAARRHIESDEGLSFRVVSAIKDRISKIEEDIKCNRITKKF